MSFVCNDEIEWIKGGGEGGAHEVVSADIKKMFEGQTKGALGVMEEEIKGKIAPAVQAASGLTGQDTSYWKSVLTQLRVHLAKQTLTEIHDTMLKRQLAKVRLDKGGWLERSDSNTTHNAIVWSEVTALYIAKSHHQVFIISFHRQSSLRFACRTLLAHTAHHYN